ncbi:MAG: hypothetical protein J5601_01320, partial [Elusimicrobiaceae bacterium]|nr:hypothetical protein [Elusimicrobiaceae bacterium]
LAHYQQLGFCANPKGTVPLRNFHRVLELAHPVAGRICSLTIILLKGIIVTRENLPLCLF